MTQEVSEQIKKDQNFWRTPRRKDILKYFIEGKAIPEIVVATKSNNAYVIGIVRHPTFLRKISDFILATQMHKAIVQANEILLLEKTLEKDLKAMEAEDRVKELNKLLGDKSFEKLSEPLINLFIRIGEEKRKKVVAASKDQINSKSYFDFEEVPISDEEHKQIETGEHSGMADGKSDQNE